jgi:aminoglycoside phosphotransferase (APT) family kinase protein
LTDLALQESLKAVLCDAFDDEGLGVDSLQRLTGGASRETWSFRVHSTAARSWPLILRRDPPTESRPGGMQREALALKAAQAAGVPVPDVIAYGGDSSVLGSPFIIMSFVEGETLPRRILREPGLAYARSRFALQAGEALARIHSISPSNIEGLTELDLVEHYRTVLGELGEPRPALELAFKWLDVHQPRTKNLTVVHGDYRNGNFVVGSEGIRAVLDWELVHLGDPMEDLGYLCVRAWRFGQPSLVGGLGSFEELSQGYVAGGGDPLDKDTLMWWIVAGTIMWGVSCREHLRDHRSGIHPSIEQLAIGRRVVETEYDLMRLIS